MIPVKTAVQGDSRSGPRRRLPGRAAVPLIVLIVASCSARQAQPESRDEVLAAVAQGPAAVCVAEPFPTELPSADAVVDSAVLVQGLQELLTADPPPKGAVLLSIGFDEVGYNIRRDVIAYSTTRAVADSVRNLVFGARRTVDESEDEWGVRLRIDVGEVVTFEVGRREFCPAAPRNRAMRDAMHSYSPAGVRVRGRSREQTIHMRVFINELGGVTRGRIVRGGLPGSSQEREVVEYLRRFLFVPATADGYPTGSWIEIPIRVRLPT